MRRTVRSEWIKLRTVLSHKILVILAIAFPVIVITLTATFAGMDGAPNSLELSEFVLGLCVVTAMLLGVVTAIALTSEYTHNTIRPTYAATPKRPRVLAAKFLVSTVLTLVVTACVVFACWFSASSIMDARGGSVSIGDDTVLAVLLSTIVLAVLVTWFGFGIGLLIRNSPASVSLLLLWPLLIEGLIQLVFGLLDWDGASQWVPYQGAIAASGGDPAADGLGRPEAQLWFAAVGLALVGIGVWLDGRRDA